ncbi:MAG: nicotinamide riboside transporter PnuC [Bacteroidota bacterium]|nr:nicotinamide riboside transporter PnuC [Bacteroidota bacterium]
MSESWLLSNWIEIAGAVISLIYLYFSIKQRILLWPFGVMSALFYILIYFQNKLYADMGLQVYYVVISIYGWMVWSRKSELSGKRNLNISHISLFQTIMLIVVFIILSGIFNWILIEFTDSDVPFWDAITTAGGVVATWMLARKYIEHWLFWVLLNIISIGLYIYKGLYPTTILFAVYTTMALVGYRTWKKLLNDQSS